MRHPVRVLNPNETCNQRCPVFPNRTPGRQPSVSHGWKVAGSTFLKFQRRLRIAHQKWIRRSICWFWRLRQICAHCTWCNILSFLLQVRERLDQDEAPRSLSSGSLLTPAKAGCYSYPAGVSESPPTADTICLLTSTAATAEPDFPRRCEGELRLRNFGSPRMNGKGRKALNDCHQGISDAPQIFKKNHIAV